MRTCYLHIPRRTGTCLVSNNFDFGTFNFGIWGTAAAAVLSRKSGDQRKRLRDHLANSIIQIQNMRASLPRRVPRFILPPVCLGT